MARRALRLEVAVAWLCILPACSSTRAITYFTLDPPPEPVQADALAPPTHGTGQPNARKGEPLDIQVDRFRAFDIYDEPRMAWGEGPQLDHFKYCRWAAPPPKMLEDVVIRALRESGEFRSVERYSETHSEMGVLLQCELRHILIQGAGHGKWKAILRAEVRLLKVQNGVWTQVGVPIPLEADGEGKEEDGEEGVVKTIKAAVKGLDGDLKDKAAKLAETIGIVLSGSEGDGPER